MPDRTENSPAFAVALEPVVMRLGELIKNRREQAGMSLQDLADACGATKSHLWEVEQGRTVNIGLLLAVRLSVALGVPVNALAAAAIEAAEATKKEGAVDADTLLARLGA